MKTLTNIIAIIGFLIFIGTAGSLDEGTIGFGRAVIQIIVGMLMFIGGVNYGLRVH